VAPLQLHVDVAPRGADAIAAANQAVVDNNAGCGDQDEYSNDRCCYARNP
jgi:hypothetical protein